jgi:type VI secretion system protein VasD
MINPVIRLWLVLSLLALFPSLQGCSMFSSSTQLGVPVELKITAGKSLNPSSDSSANPVVVNIYQLTNAAPFSGLSALSLFQKDAQLLAGTLVEKRTLPALLPGETRSLNLVLKPETKVIGVFAQFSNYSESKGIAWVKLGKNEKIGYFELNVDLLSANLKMVKPHSFW